MTRKDVRGAIPEATDEQVAAILKIYHDDVDAIKDQLDEANSKLTAANKDKDDALKAKETAENALTTYKNEQANKETKAAKEKAYKAILTEEGISEKYAAQILKLKDLSEIELNKDGTIKGAEKVKADIKAEWPEFIGKPKDKGQDVETPPAGGKKYSGMTKADILKIKDATERQTAIAQNGELFGI